MFFKTKFFIRIRRIRMELFHLHSPTRSKESKSAIEYDFIFHRDGWEKNPEI